MDAPLPHPFYDLGCAGAPSAPRATCRDRLSDRGDVLQENIHDTVEKYLQTMAGRRCTGSCPYTSR